MTDQVIEGYWSKKLPEIRLDEYMCSDQNSSVKLYSTNGNYCQSWSTIAIQERWRVQEIRYRKNESLRFLDNAGWDVKKLSEIEDADIFSKTKENPYAKDYVLVANLSGVEDKNTVT